MPNLTEKQFFMLTKLSDSPMFLMENLINDSDTQYKDTITDVFEPLENAELIDLVYFSWPNGDREIAARITNKGRAAITATEEGRAVLMSWVYDDISPATRRVAPPIAKTKDTVLDPALESRAFWD